ncbi:cyclic nucleotide-binding-like protein [Obelidium mucronatum]|nr:cyclic nucleotide-binding-like protein [Obelidium mucronatum]
MCDIRTTESLDYVAANIDSKSVSILTDRLQRDEETITYLKDQVMTLTKERDDMMEYIRATNQMVVRLIAEVGNTERVLKEATEKHLQSTSQLGQIQSTLRDPKEFISQQTNGSAIVGSRFMSDTLIRRGTHGHVTVLKENEVNDTLQTLQQENAHYHPYISVLQRFPLFATFPRDVMEKVSLSAYEMTRKKGQPIVTKGEEGAEIFFIWSGAVSIFVEERELSHLQQPVFFGELGVLFKFRRTATVVAKTDTVLIVVTKQKLDEIIGTNPEVQQKVDEFSANKEVWWLKQQYTSGQEKFGSEFANDIARKNIRKLDLFHDAPDSFVDSLAMTIKCLVFQENQNIVSIGDESDAMYFLLAGTVQVVGDTGVVHAEIQQGSFFGEVGVLLNMKRTASIRSKGESYVFKLTKENLDAVVLNYPLMKERLQEEATERFALFKARTQKKEGSCSSVPDQFDVEVGENALAKLSIFHGVDLSVIQELAITMLRKTWNTDETIIKCGENGDSMFFLAAGTANVITEFGEVIDDVSGWWCYLDIIDR